MAGVGKLDRLIAQNDQLIALEKECLAKLDKIASAVYAGVQALSEPESEPDSARVISEEEEDDAEEDREEEVQPMEIRETDEGDAKAPSRAQVRGVATEYQLTTDVSRGFYTGSRVVPQLKSRDDKPATFGAPRDSTQGDHVA